MIFLTLGFFRLLFISLSVGFFLPGFKVLAIPLQRLEHKRDAHGMSHPGVCSSSSFF